MWKGRTAACRQNVTPSRYRGHVPAARRRSVAPDQPASGADSGASSGALAGLPASSGTAASEPAPHTRTKRGAGTEQLNMAADTPLEVPRLSPPEIEVRRSARRRRTVSAYRDGDRVIVLIPQRFTRAQEREYVERMVGQLTATEERRQQRSRARSSDEALMARVRSLSDRYLDGRAYPTSIRWVPAMRTRWASCTPLDGSIRVSTRLQSMPDWVLDYVLVHELVHLQVPGHGPQFWALVQNYPRTERARGYLDGVSAAAHLDIAEDGDDVD
ncbi:Predicted metal-dependent hydrolase [Frankineae bacterium MT45]|nr:Predicted metal-dependent hydrolase [Frankineae bacterium MT45]